MRRGLLALTCLAFAGCHPLACWHPEDFPADEPLVLDADGIDEQVEVILDDYGIPHIFGGSRPDLAYALGFMHARDRRFQMMVHKFAGWGRLTELFGEDLLSSDQFLRVFSLTAEAWELSEGDAAIVEAYSAGANAAAARYGQTAEMNLLGIEWEDWEPKDVLAVAMLQSYNLSTGLDVELARRRVANRIAPTDPRYQTFLGDALSGGVPVVSRDEHTGEAGFRPQQSARVEGPERKIYAPPWATKSARKPPDLPPLLRNLIGNIVDKPQPGGSNAWAISGEHTQSGAPILANDPHLGHTAPGIMYLAHLQTPDFEATGATIPGIPVVVIGWGQDVAWGLTTAFSDWEDTVLLAPYQGRDDLYELDGAPMNYGRITQRYKLGSGQDAEIVEEEWRTTVFGPVLPPGWAHLHDEGDTIAMLWPPLVYADEANHYVSALWDLAAANNFEEATIATGRFAFPPQSVSMAFTNGDIGYRLTGFHPIRRSDEPVGYMRNGSSREAGWRELLPEAFKPQLENPERGFVACANQRVVEADGPAARVVGTDGGQPYRAQRLTARLEELVAAGGVTAEQVLGIQKDVTNLDAQRLAPLFADYCPDAVADADDTIVDVYCEALSQFDGIYSVDATGALAYEWVRGAFQSALFEDHLGEDGARGAGLPQNWSPVSEALAAAAEGDEDFPLWENPDREGDEGLGYYMDLAFERAIPRAMGVGAFERLDSSEKHRWGSHHRSGYPGTLATIPVLGELFRARGFEQSGCGSGCLRAESGNPITDHGPALRLIAELTDPIQARIVIPTGQSGHFGHRHLDDQHERWTNTDPIELPRGRDNIEAQSTGFVRFVPQE